MAESKKESAAKARERRFQPLLKELGLPLKVEDYTEDTTVSVPQMPLKDFTKLLKLKGVPVGNAFVHADQCIAGSAVLAWITGEYESNDYDLFPRDIVSAEWNARTLEEGGWKLDGYTGEKARVVEIMGEEWEPTTHDVWDWYSRLGNTNDAEELPMQMLPPVLPATEMVRALNFKREGTKKKAQVILCIRGTPSQVIDTFDFSICQWAHNGTDIFWGAYAIQDMMRARVRIVRIHHPMSTMRRMVKYSGRGYFFCNGAMLQIAEAVSLFARSRRAWGLDPLTDSVISVD